MALPLNTHTNQYVFGRGRIFIGVYSGDANRADRRFIGNCPGFTLSVESEKFEHFSSTAGIQTKDLTVTKSVNFNAQVTCDDIQAENLALFLGGTSGTLTQVATPVTITAAPSTRSRRNATMAAAARSGPASVPNCMSG